MTGRQDLFDESMRLGTSAAWESQWDRAIEFYRKALAEFPEEPTALSNLGLALLETGQFKEALACYHRASKADANDPVPVEKCAEIFEQLSQIQEAIQYREQASDLYLRQKDVEKSIENWNHVARLNPENVTVRSRLALTYERLGRRKNAILEYLALASILQGSGKRDAAAEAVQRALTIVPGDPEATKALRLLREGQPLPPPTQPKAVTGRLGIGRVKEFFAEPPPPEPEPAQEELADPEVAAQQQALAILAGILFEEPGSGSDASGRSLGMSAISKPTVDREGMSRPSMYRYLGQAIDHQTRGRTQQAAKELKRAIDAGLNHPAAHYNLGLLLKDLQDYEGARKHLMVATGHPELALGANLALGRILHIADDQLEASRYVLNALRMADTLSVDGSQSPQLNSIYEGIIASQERGDENSLRKFVSNVLDFLTGPQWLQRLRVARDTIETQRPGERVVPIAEIIAVGGGDQVLQSLSRIDELILKARYASAMEEAMAALRYAPSFLTLHERMAEILLQSGRTDAGLEKLNVIAETHRVRGESQQAALVFAKVLQHAPINLPARTKLIELLMQQDRIEEAIQQYMELVEIYSQMADMEGTRKMLAEALEVAKRSSAYPQMELKILHKIGDLDMSLLDWRKALRTYEQIQELDPADEKARNIAIDLNLRLGQEEQAGRVLDRHLEYLVKQGKSTAAMSLLEELVREYPGKVILHSRLAEAYRAAGRTADAIAQYDALGEIQLDAGQLKDAIRTIKTIIELSPPDVEGYQELLSNLMANK
jgi:tetratricopeptide (TPR) repeat protein